MGKEVTQRGKGGNSFGMGNLLLSLENRHFFFVIQKKSSKQKQGKKNKIFLLFFLLFYLNY